MPVSKASWWHRHRVLRILAVAASVVVLVGAGVAIRELVTAPDLECEPGTVTNASSTACIGVNLTGGLKRAATGRCSSSPATTASKRCGTTTSPGRWATRTRP